MAHKLTKDGVLALARLAKLHLTDEEATQYQGELNSLLDYFEQLAAVDAEGLEPTHQVTGLSNVMREDEILEQLASPDELRAVVPKTKDRYIKVDRMI